MDQGEIQNLKESMESLELANARLEKKVTRLLSKRYAIREVLLRALSTALGATIGIALILLVLNFIIRYFNIPLVQELAKEIVQHIPER